MFVVEVLIERGVGEDLSLGLRLELVQNGEEGRMQVEVERAQVVKEPGLGAVHGSEGREKADVVQKIEG